MCFLVTYVPHYDIKVGRYSQLNEYINRYEYQRSRSFIDLRPRSQIQHFQTSFTQKPLGQLKPNFIWSLHGIWGMKICSNVPGQMTMPICGEKLQKSFPSEPRGRWLGIQHWVLQFYQCFHMMTWVDHDREGQICFRMLLHGWKLIQHWVQMYFQVCSNSAYPQHSGEQYRTNGPLVLNGSLFT